MYMSDNTPPRHIAVARLHAGGQKEATALRLTAESHEWRLEWTHAVRSSDLNPGGGGLGLVVYEQLSMHNLTLLAKTNDSSRAATLFAALVDAPGFTEWSNPSR